MRKESCHVLIVGGGGAGIRAALAAREQYPAGRIILATKGKLGSSGVTALACSDRMAFHATLPHTEPGGPDAWRYHAADIYEIGGRVSDAHLAAILARGSREAFEYLNDLGVPFVSRDGRAHQFVTDGSEYARACYTGPYTAVHIEQSLVAEFFNQDIALLEDCSVLRLATDQNGITGALAVQTGGEREEAVAIDAAAVVLATGGGGLIFADNVFPAGNTGEGAVAAYLAGAELVNMEFIQFGAASVKTKLNCSGSMMRACPRLVNEDGREFLFDYFPHDAAPTAIHSLVFRKGATWPVSYEHDTHIIDIAIYKEQLNGKKVYLDYAANPRGFEFDLAAPELQERYSAEMKTDLGREARRRTPLNRLQEINPEAVEWLGQRGVDLARGDWVELATCAQHFQGGIKINPQGETTVAGLFAAGECAGGQHGANRPGGNALLDGQVFGKIAGENAALRARQKGTVPVREEAVKGFIQELQTLEQGRGLPAGAYRSRLQEIMTGSAGVVRTREGLTRGLELVKELQEQPPRSDRAGLAYAMETAAMAVLAEAVQRAALLRDESRGPHLRFARFDDNRPLPRRDPHWQRYIVIKKSPAGMTLEPQTPQGAVP